MLNFIVNLFYTKNKVEPKRDFYNKIKKYYLELAENQIPSALLKELVDRITDSHYKTYNRFWNQYPKSRKRYSELKMNDEEFNEYELENTITKPNRYINYQLLAIIEFIN